MELTKQDSQMAKGIAIFGMVMLHLFCRTEDLPYTPLIWIGDTPLIYYLALFGDLCVPIYCFCSGYAQTLLFEKNPVDYRKNSLLHLLKFLINYWGVLLIFSIVGILFDSSGTIPGSIWKFTGNFFLFNISYNGSWWFVLTYVLLIILFPSIIKAVNNFHAGGIVLICGTLYFIAYVFRFAITIEFDNLVIGHIWEQLLLLGTSQFSFVVGSVCYKYRIISKLKTIPCNSLARNTVCVVIPLVMIVLHGIERSLIIAPITGLTTMMCFHLIDKPKWVCGIFLFLGKHSTNIWLVHMFFYLVIFKNLVFVARYPLLILLLMLAICIVTSYFINFILKYVHLILKKKGFKQCPSSV